jgi:hypothetical protein
MYYLKNREQGNIYYLKNREQGNIYYLKNREHNIYYLKNRDQDNIYNRGLQFYTFFGISIGITWRMIDIGKKITFNFLQKV